MSVVSPDEKNKKFDGGIKIVNKDAGGDQCYIQVSLTTPKIKTINPLLLDLIEELAQFFPLFYKLFEIL